jgi:hypothetical protein
MLDICDEFAEKRMMKFGYGKIVVVVHQPTPRQQHVKWTMQQMAGALGGTQHPAQIQQRTGQHKCLGMWVADDLTFNKHAEKFVLPSLCSTLGELRPGVANASALSPPPHSNGYRAIFGCAKGHLRE